MEMTPVIRSEDSTCSSILERPEAPTTDLLYQHIDGIYALAAPMMLENGWCVWPQQQTNPRRPAIINDAMFHPTTLYERLPNDAELKAFYRDAPRANVACTMGTKYTKVFCLDIDCLNTEVSQRVQQIADEVLGFTPLRRVGLAPKIALFYRHDAAGCPHTRAIALAGHDDCNIEVQGSGKAMTLHGIHHKTGKFYKWPELSPSTSSADVAPEVGALDVERFIRAVAAEFPFKKPFIVANKSYDSQEFGALDLDGIVIPDVDYTTKLADGREAFMLSLAWNVVRRNGDMLKAADAAGGLDAEKARVIAAVLSVFEQKAEMSGSWNDSSTKAEAAAKVNRAIGKLLSGEMKPWIERKARTKSSGVAALPESSDERPLIVVSAGNMAEIVDKGEEALMASSAGVYQRSGRLVRMAFDKRTTNDGIVSGRQILQLETPTLSELMGASANWMKFDARKDDYQKADVPEVVAKTLAARVGHWKFPVLSGFIGTPTLRSDGSILQESGYDVKTGLLLELDNKEWNIPENPTRDEALVSISALKTLIKDFPFVSDVDRAVALSAFMTACVRRSLPSAPMHAFSARAAGTGKSKLADIASVLTSGERAAVIGMGDSEAEMEKRLGAKFLAGDSVISIDNIERPIEGDFICQVLTQQSVSVRILGKSEAPNLPTSALLTATGNQLKFQGDMARRAVLANMDAGMERPELRVFDFEPVSHVMKHRGEYVRHCLTVLRAFQVAGKPRQANPIGSFEAWSSMVRDALLWLGEADPAASMETIRAEDPRRIKDMALLAAWWAAFEDSQVTSQDVISSAQARDTNFEYKKPDLHAALSEVAGEKGGFNINRLGAWLRRHDRTIKGSYRMEKLALSAGHTKWRISHVN